MKDHVRIFPNSDASQGFDLIARERGGLRKVGTYPTIAEALAAAWAFPNRKPGPVFVFDEDIATVMAREIAGAIPERRGA